MENETSISESIIRIWQKNNDKSQAFQLIADYLYREYSLKTEFCELYAKRWSHIASSPGIVIPRYRQELSPKYGIIYEDDSALQFVNMLQKILNNE